VLGFGGFDGGAMRAACDRYAHVPSFDYGMVESAHVVFDHCVTALLAERAAHTARTSGRPAVFVDRDGVIVQDRDDYVKRWAEVVLLPGAADALAALSRAGHRLLVVTNQSAIGRGLTSAAAVADIHDRLARAVALRGGRIDSFLVCPHRPDQRCPCRKPAPGLFRRAEARWAVDLTTAFMIGDHASDMEAARSAGARGILVLSGRTRAADAPDVECVAVVDDLRAAADLILAGASPGPAAC
jgi:histidinol-phosphate phosphatase family protein